MAETPGGSDYKYAAFALLRSDPPRASTAGHIDSPYARYRQRDCAEICKQKNVVQSLHAWQRRRCKHLQSLTRLSQAGITISSTNRDPAGWL